MADFATVVKRVLKEHDRSFDLQGRGDHEIWFSPHSNKKFPVDSDIRSRHTANALMKQAGLIHRF